jgi:hypothetical protein
VDRMARNARRRFHAQHSLLVGVKKWMMSGRQTFPERVPHRTRPMP